MKISSPKQGLIKTLIIILIAILVLSYFGFDIKKTVESEMTQKNIGYVKALTITLWNTYLKNPATKAYDFYIEYFWTPALRNLTNLRDGKKIDLEVEMPRATF